jgi:hypothetical protein
VLPGSVGVSCCSSLIPGWAYLRLQERLKPPRQPTGLSELFEVAAGGLPRAQENKLSLWTTSPLHLRTHRPAAMSSPRTSLDSHADCGVTAATDRVMQPPILK